MTRFTSSNHSQQPVTRLKFQDVSQDVALRVLTVSDNSLIYKDWYLVCILAKYLCLLILVTVGGVLNTHVQELFKKYFHGFYRRKNNKIIKNTTR